MLQQKHHPHEVAKFHIEQKLKEKFRAINCSNVADDQKKKKNAVGQDMFWRNKGSWMGGRLPQVTTYSELTKDKILSDGDLELPLETKENRDIGMIELALGVTFNILPVQGLVTHQISERSSK